MTVFEYW